MKPTLSIGIVVPALSTGPWLFEAVKSVSNALKFAREFDIDVRADVLIKFPALQNLEVVSSVSIPVDSADSWKDLIGVQGCLASAIRAAQFSHLISDWMSIRVLYKEDSSAVEALNQGFGELGPPSYNLIAWLNSDEVYHPAVFVFLAGALLESPQSDAYFGDDIWIDESGKVIELYAHHRFIPYVLRHVEPIPRSCSLFWRPSSFGSAFDESKKIVFDWAFYLSNIDGDWFYIDQALSCYRIHDAQLSSNPRDNPETSMLLSETGTTQLKFLTGRLFRLAAKILSGSMQREVSFRRKNFGRHYIELFELDEARMRDRASNGRGAY